MCKKLSELRRALSSSWGTCPTSPPPSSWPFSPCMQKWPADTRPPREDQRCKIWITFHFFILEPKVETCCSICSPYNGLTILHHIEHRYGPYYGSTNYPITGASLPHCLFASLPHCLIASLPHAPHLQGGTHNQPDHVAALPRNLNLGGGVQHGACTALALRPSPYPLPGPGLEKIKVNINIFLYSLVQTVLSLLYMEEMALCGLGACCVYFLLVRRSPNPGQDAIPMAWPQMEKTLKGMAYRNVPNRFTDHTKIPPPSHTPVEEIKAWVFFAGPKAMTFTNNLPKINYFWKY